MAEKQNAKHYIPTFPSSGPNDPIPTFRVQEIFAGIGSDGGLADYEDGEGEGSAICVDLTQDCPTVRLPEFLLRHINMKSAETQGMIRMKGTVYDRLPPDIRNAVMQTCKPNSTINDFFKKSQWKMYLQAKWQYKQKGFGI